MATVDIHKEIKIAVKYLALIFLVIGIAIGFTAGLVIKSYWIKNVGNIVIVHPPNIDLEFYSDPACTDLLTKIDWGIIDNGTSKNYTAYVKNLGNVRFNMTMHTENWAPPEAEPYIWVGWLYAGEIVLPDEVLTVVFKIKVASYVSGVTNFSFDIVIIATEV